MPVVCPLGLLSIHPRRDPARTAVDSRTGRQESVSARGEDRGVALTNIQREVCRLIAGQRIASGESYVAGGAALNTVLHAPRISQDLDLFHDTAAALAATWNVDRTGLLDAGYQVEVVRERPTFVEAIVRREGEAVILQWTHDSAFRFFPLLSHPELGLCHADRRTAAVPECRP